MDYQIINGELLHKDEAKIPLNDLGLLRGFSVFDFFRVIDGVPVFLEDHMARLQNSMSKMGISSRWSLDQISQMCHQIVKANNTVDAGLRIVVTGGFSMDGFTPAEPNIFMTLHSLPQYSPTDFSDGRKIIAANFSRETPEVKTTIYAHALRQRQRMIEANAPEVLYHTNGQIRECSRSNIFFVDPEKNIVTPDASVLQGITRKHVIALAREHYTIQQRPVTMDEVAMMKECFLTSSTKGVLPITGIEDVKIGDGTVGPITTHIRQMFLDHVKEYILEHDTAE